jgi:hypothetical protein
MIWVRLPDILSASFPQEATGNPMDSDRLDIIAVF